MGLTVIILTFDEEINIKRAIENVSNWADEVLVLDSFSKDNTPNIVKDLGVKFFQRKFDNYSNQRNFSLFNCGITNDWVLFLDADEIISDALKTEIKKELLNPRADGYYLKRRFYYMGKWIKWGGYYPIYILRLFKRDKGLFQREVNEHVVLSGTTKKLKNDFIDDNLKPISFWWHKHIDYAMKEAQVLLDKEKHQVQLDFWGGQADRKTWIKYKIWYRLPVYIRPFIYYIYRYFFRLGFLDGKVGFIFHFYHGLVYYLMIDNFYMELKNKLYK